MSAVETLVEETQYLDAGQHQGSLGLSHSIEPTVLAKIYEGNIDIAVWKRELTQSLRDTVADFVDTNPGYKTSVVLTPQKAEETLYEMLGHLTSREFCADVAILVDMFSTLFDLEEAGVRLGVLDSAMCPRFHVDRIPCRLLTTYQGVATEWLHHEHVDRSKLGHGSNGKADHESGLYDAAQGVQQLNQGHVAILKGDRWQGNQGKGLVHRSPRAEKGRRLLVTIDMIT